MSLIEEIKRTLILKAKEKERTDYGQVLHASDVYNFCPRRYALYQKYPDAPIQNKVITASQALNYALGIKIQEIVVENSLGLVGIWECKLCRRTYYGIMPKKCNTCISSRFKYRELEIKHKDMIVGHIDMVYRKTDESIIVEIKSMKPEEFKNLDKPKLQHEYQVMTYLYLINRTKLKNKILKDLKVTGKYGYILYVCKTAMQEPFKLFTIKYKREFGRKLDKHLEDLENFMNAKEPKLPERICRTKIDLMAKECNLSDICFDGGLK